MSSVAIVIISLGRRKKFLNVISLLYSCQCKYIMTLVFLKAGYQSIVRNTLNINIAFVRDNKYIKKNKKQKITFKIYFCNALEI